MKFSLLKRIEFWIALFFLIRLIGITNPPLEISHNWRQTTGLMVSRNFLEVDNNILYPRVDDNKEFTGIIGMEFPAMNYVFYLIAKVFGYEHWYGRLINLLISSLGIWSFHQLLRRYFTREVAFYGSLALLGSIWFCFSRKMMPDTFSVSLMITGLLMASQYLRSNKPGWLIGFLLVSGLGALCKIPAIIYLPVLAAIAITEKNQKGNVMIGAAATVIVAVTAWWYFIWCPGLSEKFGIWYNSGTTFSKGLSEIFSHIPETLRNFYFNAFSGFIMFPLVLTGLVLAIIRKQRSLLLILLLVMPFLFGYMVKSGYFFYHHNYYIIPAVPLMALFAGYFFSILPKQWMAPVLIALALVESLANQQHDLKIKDSEKYKLKLEAIADKVSKKGDKIVISGDFNPQMIYLSHRKGWVLNNKQLAEKFRYPYLSEHGCKFIFLDKHEEPNKLELPVVYEDEDFAVYQLAGTTGF